MHIQICILGVFISHIAEQCDMPMYKITKECNEEYNIFYEDTGEYYPGWIPVTNTSGESITKI